MTRGQLDAVGLQVGEESRPDSSRLEGSVDLTLFIGMFLHKFVNLMHLDDVAFHSGNLADIYPPPLSVRKTLQLDYYLQSRGDLATDAGERHGHICHTNHLF